MATKLYINYVRQSAVPLAPEVKKILVLSDRHLQIKRVVDGVDIVTDFDFRTSSRTTESLNTPNGYADTIYRYLIDNSDVHVWIAGVVPTGVSLPKPDYQVIEHSAAATVFKVSGETDSAETPSGTQPAWIPGALTTAEKKVRAIRAIKSWREQKKSWLLEAPEYADLVPNITTHLGYWLRSADYVLKLMYDMGVSGTFDWLIVEAITKEAIKGPRTLDPDGDGAYNTEFFQRLKVASVGYPTGPTFGALWVRTWDLTDVVDVDRVLDFTADVIQSHGQATDRTYHNIPADYDSTAIYWST